MYKGVAMELLKVKKITSLEKVFPDQEPSGEGMEDVITALKKETVSFQMAYTGVVREKEEHRCR